MSRRVAAPETALLLGKGLTELEARQLERDTAKVARALARHSLRVRQLKKQLRAAQLAVLDARRELRMLVSVRKV